MGSSGQGESTYVCDERLRGVDTQLEGLDVDNDEENEDNDEEMEDGGDEENGDEADEDEAEDGEADLPPPPTASPALAAPTTAATKAPEPPTEETKPELPVPIVTVQGAEPTPLDPAKPSPAAPAQLTEPIGVAAAAEAALAPTSAEMPSNAIEVSNIAPSAEVGHGDLGAGGGMEITRPEPSVSPSLGAASAPLAPETAVGAVEEQIVSAETAAEAEPASASTVDEKMDVDGPPDPTAEEPVAPVDEGLVMGEMHAPQPAMEVVGSDAGPKETE